VVLIENVERISAQLESKALGDLDRLFQADVKIAVTRLPEILNAGSSAGVEIEAARRFECVHIQYRLSGIEVSRRLQEWRRTGQQRGRAEVVKLGGNIAEGRGNLKRNSRLRAEYAVKGPPAEEGAGKTLIQPAFAAPERQVVAVGQARAVPND